MLQYNTLHRYKDYLDRRRWIKKYFEIWMPHDHLMQERVSISRRNVDPCTIQITDQPIYDMLGGKITENLARYAQSTIYEEMPLCVYGDVCDDANLDYDRKDIARIALFVFWRMNAIDWNKRLFLELQYPSTFGEQRIRDALDREEPDPRPIGHAGHAYGWPSPENW